MVFFDVESILSDFEKDVGEREGEDWDDLVH